MSAQLCSSNRSTKSDGPSSFSKHEYIHAFLPARGYTVACHARRERESAEVAKAAAQLLSREPRVFIRPNVRGTLVAIEKAASHSVSLFTIIMWGARSRFERIWLSYWIHSSLFFHFASSITIITIITSILFTLKSAVQQKGAECSLLNRGHSVESRARLAGKRRSRGSILAPAEHSRSLLT